MSFFKGFNQELKLILSLRVGAFLCLLGWAWVHFYWEAPYAILVWNETVFSWVERGGGDWEKFVGTGSNDGLLQQVVRQLFWIFLIAAAASFAARKCSIWKLIALLMGSLFLIILFYARYLESQQQLPILIEHGGQALMPIILVLALKFGPRYPLTQHVAILAVMLTFAGHGAYALGLWPTPANYFAMTKLILGLDFEASVVFLKIAGVMDFLICVGFLFTKLRRISAGYAFCWGLLTALARPLAGMSFDLHYWGADQFIHEAMLRAPHFMVPLYLLVLWHPVSEHET